MLSQVSLEHFSELESKIHHAQHNKVIKLPSQNSSSLEYQDCYQPTHAFVFPNGSMD
jgi:hypothetical protein